MSFIHMLEAYTQLLYFLSNSNMKVRVRSILAFPEVGADLNTFF